MERVLDLTLKLADDGLSAEEQLELERLVDGDAQALARHLQMLEVEAALRSARYSGKDPDARASGSAAAAEESRVKAVLETIGRRVPRRWPVLQSRRVRIGLVTSALAAMSAAALFAFWQPTGRRANEGQAGATTTFGRMASSRALGARHEVIGEARGTRGRGWSSAVVPVQAPAPGDQVTFDLGEGAKLEVRGRAALAVERATALAADDGVATRVTVDDGVVAYRRDGRHTTASSAQTVLSTPHADVFLRGGRAVLVVAAHETRVQILDGQAVVATRMDGHTTTVPARQGAIVSSSGRTTVSPIPSLLFVSGRHMSRVPPELLDAAIERRLETLGFAVDAVHENELRADHLRNRALVVISPSVTSTMHDRVQDLSIFSASVPVLCSRPMLYGDLGMTAVGRANAEFSERKRNVVITDTTHPLAAGLTGNVEVLSATMSLGWGTPAPSASRVAALRDKPDQSAVFAYERGAAMFPPTNHAPARRVGFFLHPTGARFLSESAWSMFDAAVKWAADDAAN